MDKNRTVKKIVQQSGQAMIEYALIIVLVVFAFWIAIQATGPAIGNVFNNTVTNLLGMDPDEVADVPGREDFWMTVTWVASQTPQEFPLPTRTLAPPTKSPTPGPSPTNTPITPTNTPTQTPTDPPTATPVDYEFDAPWSDSANEMAFWRLDRTGYIGSDGWYVRYYGNPELNGSPDAEYWTRELDPALEYTLDYDWGSYGPQDFDGSNLYGSGTTFKDDWGARFTRQIIIQADGTDFTVDIGSTNNGVRVWILGGGFGGNPSPTQSDPGTCSSTGIESGGSGSSSNVPNAGSGGWATYGGTSTDCLLLDRWRHSDSASNGSVTRTLDHGIYTIQVDFYEDISSAYLRDVNLSIGGTDSQMNPDDVTNGNQCDWQNNNDNVNDPNTADYMWDEYYSGNMPSGMTCHIELRGRVNVDIANPTFSFWHIWDLRNSSDQLYVQFAEYDPNNDGLFDRGDLTWTTVAVVSGNTTNYNWSRFVVDLTNVNGVDFSQTDSTDLAFRFVIESGSGTSTRRWYIDDIVIDSEDYSQDLYMNKLWDLNTPEQADDFIVSGRWELTSDKIVGGSGMSWESSPNTTVPDFSQYLINSTNNSATYENENVRMHTIELGGFVDIDNPAGATDLEGDQGDPLLTFWHAVDVRSRMGLEIQYTEDDYTVANPDWQTLHVVRRDESQIYERNHDYNNSSEEIPSMTFYEVPLSDLPTGVTRVRLRFAIVMPPNANLDHGWWIDDIQLERLGKPKYMDYPLFDPAEDPITMNQWLMGVWGRIEGGVFPDGSTGYAYADSPAGDYDRNSEPTMLLRYPWDVFNDTPDNPVSPACNLGGGLCESAIDAAVDPVMTFWHWRDMRDTDLYVEWKRFDEDDASWRVLWVYQDRMQTNGSGYSSSTRTSVGWERVEINLEPMLDILQSGDDGGNPEDDDIVFRFRLDTGNNNNDGVSIDNIRIEERDTEVYNLWADGQTRDDADGDTVEEDDGSDAEGDSERFFDGLDNNSNLYDDWYFGGDWEVIDWEQHDGLLAFHDSPDDQTEAPYDSTTADTDSVRDQFNVLEMAEQIDLRGVDASDSPIMYFWTRYYSGSSHDLLVQISYRDIGNSHSCRISGLDQCYEKLYDWSEWETVWSMSGGNRVYTWQREQVDLSAYAKSGGNDGKRIRIRFVSDTLDTGSSNDRDGWYIDDISIEYYDPDVYPISKNISGGTFYDAARNMSNWVAEGVWGLSPQLYRGGGGGPASLGTSSWSYSYWNVNSCPYNWQYKTCVSNYINANTADASGVVLEINNEYGWGSPSGAASVVGSDRFAARWTLTTAEVGVGLQAGTYTLITVSDDGVRVKYENLTTGTVVCGSDSSPLCGASDGWNIINDWNDQGRSVNMGSMTLAAGNRYKITVEYYERSSSAVMTLSTGANNFSFTDSPKQAAGPSFPEVPATPWGNSSLILDGVFDLSDAVAPVIQYYTYYELGGTGRVEVTTDGGFTWTQVGLQGSIPASYWNEPGWQADYYNGRNFDTYVTTDTNVGPNISFNWGNGRPETGVNTDNFSIRYTRTLTLTTPLEVTFSTASDDGNRLYIDGSQVISAWYDSGNATGTYTTTLAAGTHTIIMEMYENGGGAKASLNTVAGSFDNPNISGTWLDDDGAWRLRTHDLSGYAGFPALGLRFRLDRTGVSPSSNYENQTTQSDYNYFESWWITDITVVDP